jgi:antitoxin CptB
MRGVSMEGAEHDYARLRWRCRRGMLELDLLLQGFLDKGYRQLGKQEQERFIRLLELPDQRLLEYLLHSVPVKEKEFTDVIERIRTAAAT